MEVGVLGEVVVNHVVLEFRQEHVQILHQPMEVPSVLDLQINLVTDKHVLVINLSIFLVLNTAQKIAYN